MKLVIIYGNFQTLFFVFEVTPLLLYLGLFEAGYLKRNTTHIHIGQQNYGCGAT